MRKHTVEVLEQLDGHLMRRDLRLVLELDVVQLVDETLFVQSAHDVALGLRKLLGAQFGGVQQLKVVGDGEEEVARVPLLGGSADHELLIGGGGSDVCGRAAFTVFGGNNVHFGVLCIRMERKMCVRIIWYN